MMMAGGSGRPRPALLVVMALLIPAAAGFGQIIENPAKPLAANAGRVIALTEAWRITDESGEFYFKYPRDLKIAEDGSIFLCDIDQFLKFTPDGRFLRNLYKKGQGPGEMQDSAFQYDLRGRDLYILDRNAGRFWRADLEGRFQEQYDVTGISDPEFVGVVPEGFLFLIFVWPPRSEFTGKTVEVPQRVVLASWDGRMIRDFLKFDRQFFLAPHAALYDKLLIIPGPDGQAIYMFNGWDYRIDVIESTSAKTIKRITRIYPKFRIVWTDEQDKRRQASGTPRYEFAPDVNNLFPTEEGLWVETSTEDKAKGRLFDVFDKAGHFIDSFYLGPGRTLMAVREGFIFCMEKNEDETIMIIKYRIVK